MAPASIFPTGVTIYRPDKAYNCYVQFDGRDTNSYLIDMNGNDVKVWDYTGFPSEIIDPSLTSGERGHVFVQKEPELFYNKTLLELNWEGDIVWEWGQKAPGGSASQGHAQRRLANGNTLVLSGVERVVPDVSDKPQRDQSFYEVTPGGEIVWRWVCSDHLDELGLSQTAKELMGSNRMRPRPFLLVLNSMAPLGPNKWYGASEARFHPDNIMTSCRDANVIAIIEKGTGKVVWRMGPEFPASYDYSKRSSSSSVPRPVDIIVGPHDAHMIREGLPGAGNVLVFDNQGQAGFPPAYLAVQGGSRVLEIDPTTKDIVWQYDATYSNKPVWMFFSSFISSAERLPNGNTLICEGMHGRIFQVTPEGEIVWEYVNPHYGRWTESRSGTGNIWFNWIFHALPVPYDWVPEGVPRSETPVIPPDLHEFRV